MLPQLISASASRGFSGLSLSPCSPSQGCPCSLIPTCHGPSSCPCCPAHASWWEDNQWGWRGGLGQLGNRLHSSLARLCPGHKGQSESRPGSAAEGLEGGNRETHIGVAVMELSATVVPRGFTSETGRKGKAGSYSSPVRGVSWELKQMMIIMMIGLLHYDVLDPHNSL